MNWNTLSGRLVERARSRSCSQPHLDFMVPLEDWPRCGCAPGKTTLVRRSAAGGRAWLVFGVQPAGPPRWEGVTAMASPIGMLPVVEAARVLDMGAIVGLVVVFMAGVVTGLALAAVVGFAEAMVRWDGVRRKRATWWKRLMR